MLWAKILVPVLLTVTGAGAGVAAVALSDDAPPVKGPARAWVDSPLPGAVFGPGNVPVDAHAADPESAITRLELVVDGEAVTSDGDLERHDDLVFARFDWDAAVGVHEVVVREVGGGALSPPRTIVISDAAAPAPVRPADEPGDPGSALNTIPGPGPATESTNSTPPPETTTTLGDHNPLDTVPPGPDDTSGTDTTGGTGPVNTVPPSDTEPAPAPEILRAFVSPDPGTLYVQGCGYSVDVTVLAVGAEAVTVSVDGTPFFQAMARNGDEYQLTIGGGQSWAGAAGTHSVVVVAGNGSNTVTQVAGSVTIDDRVTCPKD